MIAAIELWLFVPVFLAGWAGTVLLRRYGMRRLLDIPNARSSHARPVPRGGGLAIVLAFFAGALTLWWAGHVPTQLLAALLCGGGLIAAVGFWDDHVDLPARVRLPLHVVGAVVAVALLGPVQHVPFGDTPWTMPVWLAWPLSALAVAWLLNLYNFMDGIDGIAAVEAVSVALAAVLVSGLLRTELPALTLLAAAAAGFLVLNWPPARIFMGDTGSGFLGYTFACYVLFSAHADMRLLWVWCILLAIFWVDATVTLVRRLARGERIYMAHRSHAYQCAAGRLGGHRPVTVSVLAINVLVLLPLAIVAAMRPQQAHLVAAATCAALATLAISLGAGRRQISSGADRCPSG